MSHSPVVFSVSVRGVLWLIPVMLAGLGLKAGLSARLKGAAGERAVRRVLDRLGQATLHDVILPDGRGGLTQIDHLALTPAGLVVVETKNYAGQIFGQVRDATWTQRLGRQRFTFQNPLRQNYLHVQALKALAPTAPIQGRVVFTDTARFPRGVPEGVSTVSTLRADLTPLFQGGVVSAELQDAWGRITQAARTDRASRKAHWAALRERQGQDWRKVIAGGLLLVAAVWLAALIVLRVPLR